jgi:peptide chain release factor subunit 1
LISNSQVLSDPIAGLRSPNGALVSVYAQRPSPGGFAALLLDLLKPIRDEAETKGRDVRISVRRDLKRIRDLSERLERESAPSYAIFASDIDDVFVVEWLTHPVPNISELGPRPYMRPLRAAPRPFRAGIVVADRALTRVFVSAGDLVEEIGAPLVADIGKTNYGGFSGYDESSVRARAEEASSRAWKEASTRLMEVHQSRPLDYMAIGAHDEATEEIGRALHPYLASLHRATFTASPQSVTLPMLRAELADIGESVRRKRQVALAGRVCDTAWSGGLAVLGLQSTIAASNAQAVEVLAVAGRFARSGVICNACGYLARSGGTCPVCRHPMFAVEDIVSAVMDATVAAGGRVHQIGVASALDAEGIGALTRFPFQG